MRPHALSKLGYYPTPDKTSAEIAASIRAISTSQHCLLRDQVATAEPEQRIPGAFGVTILDPCCGTGAAVKHLADAIALKMAESCLHQDHHQVPVRTHGIEPNVERFEAADLILDRTINASIEQCRIPANAYDVVFLNPPYDRDNEHDFNRLETYFLDIVTPALKARGTLILIVPQHTLPDMTELLASNFTDVRAYRMSDPEFKDFRQTIIFAQREPQIYQQPPNPYIADYIIGHASDEEDAISLMENLDQLYPSKFDLHLTTSTNLLEPRVSRTTFSAEGILQAADRSPVLKTAALQSLLVPSIEQPTFRPLEPLRRGHVCLLAANGQLDNITLFDEKGVLDPVIIKGSSQRRLVTTDHDEERGTYTAQEQFEANISVMNLRNGDIDVISEDTDDLTAFFTARQSSIDAAVRERYKPAIDPMDPKYENMRHRVADLNRTLLGKQAPSSIVMAAQLRQQGHCFGVGQQGSGKTTLAIAAAHAAEFANILVVTPSHNVQTWADEVADTNPNAKVRIINGIGSRGHPQTHTFTLPYAETDLETIRATPSDPDHPVYAIMGRDGQNKLTYPYEILSREISKHRPLFRTTNTGGYIRPASYRMFSIVQQLRRQEEDHKRNPYSYRRTSKTTVPDTHATCPECWVPLPTGKKAPTGRQARCPNCRMHLAAPDIKHASDRTYPRARYIGKHMPNWADLFIIDEAHQFRGKTSAQAEVYGALAQRSKRTLALTGTLIGGKASECFRLLASMSPPFYDRFRFSDWKKFTETYGRYEYVFETETNNHQVGRRSARRAPGYQPKELNGFHPSMMDMFWENAIFIRITDIKRDLPDPDIYVHLCPLDEQSLNTKHGTTTQKAAYQELETELKENLQPYIKDRDMAPLGQYLQELLTYPENGWQGTSPMDINSVRAGKPTPIVVLPPLPEDYLYPKERQMLDIVADEIDADRKILLYVSHTKNRNTAKRVLDLLTQRMIRARIMPDGNAKGRLRWIQKTAPETDVIICHPRKVETGLNLLEFPTIVWYEHDPSMYTVEQASARSHRINQPKRVHIHHLAYANTMQERYLRLIAEKADTSRMIYGELGTTGLSAFNPNSDELRQVIAREMLNRVRGNIDRDIDAVSGAMSDILYNHPDQDLQDLFRSTQSQQHDTNLQAVAELYDGPDFPITTKHTSSLIKTAIFVPAQPDDEPATPPMTWQQWRSANNLKQSRRRPDNQLVLL